MGFSFGSFKKEEANPQSETTPSLAQIIKDAVRDGMAQTNVGMPAEVVKYDHEKQTVDVKPQLKKKFKDGKTEETPIIYKVPLQVFRSGKSFVTVPIGKGDTVWLSFSNRSMDKWRGNGGEVDPEDTRMFSMTDCVAYPGGYPQNKAAPVANNKDLIIGNHGDDNSLEIRVKKNGKIQIRNNGEELINVINDFITTVRRAVVYTSTGPQKLRHLDFTPVQRRLKTFLSKD